MSDNTEIRLVTKTHHRGASPQPSARKLTPEEVQTINAAVGLIPTGEKQAERLAAVFEIMIQHSAWLEIRQGHEEPRYMTAVKKRNHPHFREFAREHELNRNADLKDESLGSTLKEVNGPLDFHRAFTESMDGRDLSAKPSTTALHSSTSAGDAPGRLGGVLLQAMEAAGIISIANANRRQDCAAALEEKLGALELAKGIIASPYVAVVSIGRQMRLLRALLRRDEANWPEYGRPYGIVVVKVLSVHRSSPWKIKVRLQGRNETWTVHGHLSISGREGTAGPWIGILTIAEDAENRGAYELITARLFPIQTINSFMVCDSNLEREIANLLETFSASAAARGVVLNTTKPITGLLNDRAFPDFIIESGGKHYAIEVLGSTETNYLDKKLVQRLVMIEAGWAVYHVKGYLRYYTGGAELFRNELCSLSQWLISCLFQR